MAVAWTFSPQLAQNGSISTCEVLRLRSDDRPNNRPWSLCGMFGYSMTLSVPFRNRGSMALSIQRISPVVSVLMLLVGSGCTETVERRDNSSVAGSSGSHTGGAATGGSFTTTSTNSLGGAPSTGGFTSVGGASSAGGTVSDAGASSAGGTVSGAGASTAGAVNSHAGATSTAGTTSAAGATSTGAANSIAGAPSTAGTTSNAGASSTGGTTSVAGASSAGAANSVAGAKGDFWSIDFGSVQPTAIAACGYHTCAVVGGGVQCWGDNYAGELGNDTTNGSLVPVQVTGLTSSVTAISAGYYHVCAVVNAGVQCWGSNSHGQLGNGTTSGSLVPVQVTGLTIGVSAIAAGYEHTCAIANGGLQCWGRNDSGQLGDGSGSGTSFSRVPIQVVGLTTGVTAIAAGFNHTCAVVGGGVQCWGGNSVGQLGDGNGTKSSLVPVQVVGLTTGVTAIASDYQHTCAVANGGVQCWGQNYTGQLGDGSGSIPNYSDVPVQVFGATAGVTAIDVGNRHTCAVINGGVQCLGYNRRGQLGSGATDVSRVPVPVQGLTTGVTAIAAGYEHTCAIANSGLQCWGWNELPGLCYLGRCGF